MAGGGLALLLLGSGCGAVAWLWLRERRWRQRWQQLAAELHLQLGPDGHTLRGSLGDAQLTASLQGGPLALEVVLPAGRLGGLTVQRPPAGPLLVEADDPAYASVFLVQPGVGSGLEGLLTRPGDRLVGRRLLLTRPAAHAEHLPALLAEVGLLLDALQDAAVPPRRPPARDPFFVPRAGARPTGPLEPSADTSLEGPRIAPHGGGRGVLPAAASDDASEAAAGAVQAVVLAAVERVERTLGADVPAALAGGWTAVGQDASGETCAVRLPPGAERPTVGARLSVRGRVGAPDPFWGWRVVEVEAG